MARRKKAETSLVGSLLLSFTIMSTATMNITAILEEFPDFTTLNEMLTETKVADEINSRESLTLLAPSNDAMEAFNTANPDMTGEAAGDVLRYHVLLRYITVEDLQLEGVENPTKVSTLFSLTGKGTGDDGYVNIYNTSSKILVGHSTPDNYPNSTVVNTVFQQPFDISIIMVDRTLEPAGSQPAPVEGANITGVLESVGGYTTFLSMMNRTGVEEVFNDKKTGRGITIFAPTDEAFAALPTGWFDVFDVEQQRLLMQYHAIRKYHPLGALWDYNDKLVPTVSSEIEGPDRYNLLITAEEGVVTIFSSSPNKPNATLSSTLYDDSPIVMYSIDAVLLPVELFGDSALVPTSAPVPAPASDLAPVPPSAVEDTLRDPTPAFSPVAPPATSASVARTDTPVHLALLSAFVLWFALII